MYQWITHLHRQDTRLVFLRGFLFIALLSSLSLFGAGCGSSDSDDDNVGGDDGGGGSTASPCEEGENRYFCMHSVITPAGGGQPLSDEWEVVDICGDSGDYEFGPECDVNVDGTNVSFACEYEQDLGGGCTVSYDYNVSGTVTATHVDLNGTMDLIASGTCPGGFESGSYVFDFDGTSVTGPDVTCGPGGTESFSLEVTQPGPTVITPSATVAMITHNTGGPSWALSFTGSGNDGRQYSLNMIFPDFTTLPATFDVLLEGTGDTDATMVYSESSGVSYLFTMASGAGTITDGSLTISSQSDNQLAGTFSVTGTGMISLGGSGTETRTLEGSFQLPVTEVLASPAPVIPKSLQAGLVRAILEARELAEPTGGRTITGP